MESICVRAYNGQMLRNWNFGSTWGPPDIPMGCTVSLLLILFLFQGIKIRPLWLSGQFWLNTGCSWDHYPEYVRAHCKHSSLIPHQFPIIKLILLICGCMCAGKPGHILRHTGQTSLNNNNIMINWSHTTRYITNIMLLSLVMINLWLVTCHFTLHTTQLNNPKMVILV